MLFIGIIIFGMLIAAVAQLILGKRQVNWPAAIIAGLTGSFVGGLLAGLLSGDGSELRPSGLIGSLVGAIILTAGWLWWQGRARRQKS